MQQTLSTDVEVRNEPKKFLGISLASKAKPYLVPCTANRPVLAHGHYYKDCIRIKVSNHLKIRYKPIIQQIYLEIRHKF